MKVMFYRQHVQGITHLVRSAEIARALSPGDDVTFVSGGVSPLVSLRASSRHSLSWHSSNAVLHYPATSRTPVAQALNMPVWKEAFERLTVEARP